MGGTDEKKVGEIFNQMQMGVAMGKGAMEGMAKADKKLKGYADLMDSIVLKRDGNTVTGEAIIPEGAGSSPLGLFFGFFTSVRAVAPPPDVLVEPLIEEVEDGSLEVAPEPRGGAKLVPVPE